MLNIGNYRSETVNRLVETAGGEPERRAVITEVLKPAASF